MALNSYIGSAVAKPEANWGGAGHSDPLLTHLQDPSTGRNGNKLDSDEHLTFKCANSGPTWVSASFRIEYLCVAH